MQHIYDHYSIGLYSCPTISEICPKTENIINPAIIDVKLLTIPIKIVSRKIVVLLRLNDENAISDPNPIPIELKICEVAFTQT